MKPNHSTPASPKSKPSKADLARGTNISIYIMPDMVKAIDLATKRASKSIGAEMSRSQIIRMALAAGLPAIGRVTDAIDGIPAQR